ncbi:MAG: hypothetical protein PVF87_08330, partial [Acidimicrobiia bacterium]
FAFWRRRRSQPSVRNVAAPQLRAGLYLFSSASCATCDGARREIVAAVGTSGFSEIVWEQQPDLFGVIGVEAVPATLVMGEKGRGRLYPGSPRKALSNR